VARLRSVNVDATIGDEALVPPYTFHEPPW